MERVDLVRLGRTGLQVGAAGLGTGGYSRIGQGQGKSFDHSVAIVHAALDLGVTLIDTSSFYGTEEIVGAAIKARRDGVVISTKNLMVRPDTSLTGTEYLLGAEFKLALEGNLTRLGTDHVDILHVHGVCAHQYPYCAKELIPVLLELRDEGKIRFLAISERFNFETDHRMLRTAMADGVWDVIMVGFNIVNQTAMRDVLPQALQDDVGTLCIYAVRSHLGDLQRARGLVEQAIAAGEVDPGELDQDDPLGFLLTEGGAASLAEACYRFCRHVPGANVVLTGTGSLEHLRENIRSINALPLPPAVIARLAKIFGRVGSISGD